jgi:hypothetical protein
MGVLSTILSAMTVILLDYNCVAAAISASDIKMKCDNDRGFIELGK